MQWNGGEMRRDGAEWDGMGGMGQDGVDCRMSRDETGWDRMGRDGRCRAAVRLIKSGRGGLDRAAALRGWTEQQGCLDNTASLGWSLTRRHPGYMSRKIRNFRTDKFDT